MDTALGLVAVAALIAANAFFVATEFALVAVDRTRVEQQAADGRRRAANVLDAARPAVVSPERRAARHHRHVGGARLHRRADRGAC